MLLLSPLITVGLTQYIMYSLRFSLKKFPYRLFGFAGTE